MSAANPVPKESSSSSIDVASKIEIQIETGIVRCIENAMSVHYTPKTEELVQNEQLVAVVDKLKKENEEAYQLSDSSEVSKSKNECREAEAEL